MELVRRTDNYYGYQMESSDAQQQRFCPINLAPRRPCTRVLCVGVFVKVVNKPCQCTSFKKGQGAAEEREETRNFRFRLQL